MIDGVYQCRACYHIVTDEVPMLCDRCLSCSWVFVRKGMDQRQVVRLFDRYPTKMQSFIITYMQQRKMR